MAEGESFWISPETASWHRAMYLPRLVGDTAVVEEIGMAEHDSQGDVAAIRPNERVYRVTYPYGVRIRQSKNLRDTDPKRVIKRGAVFRGIPEDDGEWIMVVHASKDVLKPMPQGKPPRVSSDSKSQHSDLSSIKLPVLESTDDSKSNIAFVIEGTPRADLDWAPSPARASATSAERKNGQVMSTGTGSRADWVDAWEALGSTNKFDSSASGSSPRGGSDPKAMGLASTITDQKKIGISVISSTPLSSSEVLRSKVQAEVASEGKKAIRGARTAPLGRYGRSISASGPKGGHSRPGSRTGGLRAQTLSLKRSSLSSTSQEPEGTLRYQSHSGLFGGQRPSLAGPLPSQEMVEGPNRWVLHSIKWRLLLITDATERGVLQSAGREQIESLIHDFRIGRKQYQQFSRRYRQAFDSFDSDNSDLDSKSSGDSQLFIIPSAGSTISPKQKRASSVANLEVVAEEGGCSAEASPEDEKGGGEEDPPVPKRLGTAADTALKMFDSMMNFESNTENDKADEPLPPALATLLPGIKTDIERTYQSVEIFRTEDMRSMMLRILGTWVITYGEDVGYAQWVSQILAVVLLAIINDHHVAATKPRADAPERDVTWDMVERHPRVVAKLLNLKYLEADAYTLLGLLTTYIYEWQGAESGQSAGSPRSSVSVNSALGTLRGSLGKTGSGGRSGSGNRSGSGKLGSTTTGPGNSSGGRSGSSKTRKTSIRTLALASQVDLKMIKKESRVSLESKMSRIHHVLLKGFDFKLYTLLERARVLPQLYLLRWLRLLFAREFRLAQVFDLWDELLQNLDLAEYLCVSMLIQCRKELFEVAKDNGDSAVVGSLLRPSSFVDRATGPMGVVRHAVALMEGQSAFTIVPRAINGFFPSKVWNRVVLKKKRVVSQEGERIDAQAKAQRKSAATSSIFARIKSGIGGTGLGGSRGTTALKQRNHLAVHRPHVPRSRSPCPRPDKGKTLPEKSAQAARASDSTTARMNFQGHLVKTGGGTFGKLSMKLRWFVLSGKTLRYYKTKSKNGEPLKEVDLTGRSVQVQNQEKLHFVIKAATIKGRRYDLYASDEQAMSQWVSALSVVCDGGLKSAKPKRSHHRRGSSKEAPW